ncbi:hypothetical protein WICPIJ_000753 [Wickerhamomyces pijperi]|uniref:General transcription and DNA repair factor IIH subunit TFB4 n=1 Tax=Wickerhamomyces pijperi TaxID=599730 RepID=A0A9P8QCY0_WICPI|nr:hypothetical protein WICPIJ_000753 [Wickerhamomyces pijperi]
MDAIADKTFKTDANSSTSHNYDSPSLLTVIIDTNPVIWEQLEPTLSFKAMLESLTVSINSHLALNNANEVAVIANHYEGAQFLYPCHVSREDEENQQVNFVKTDMYRQFRIIDDSFLSQAFKLFKDDTPPTTQPKNFLSASLSLALAYINKKQSHLKSRILIMNVTPDTHLQYIPIMNSIFAAEKNHIPIDVAQLSPHYNSTFLQQASDATHGVYLQIKTHTALIQYMMTVFFIDLSIRDSVIIPGIKEIDFRAACYVTGDIVDVGFVCSVCLCILSDVSLVGKERRCPVCDVQFDVNVLRKLADRKFAALIGSGANGESGAVKKRKLINGQSNGTGTTATSATASPMPL